MGLTIRNQKDFDQVFQKYKAFISTHYYDLMEDVILGIRKSMEVPDAK